MVIYLDILVLLNLFVNYYLLFFTSKLLGEKPKFRRMLFASFVGAALSLSIFLPDWGFLFSLVLRIIISAAVTFSCFGFGNRKRFIRNHSAFFLSTFAFGGIMLGLWQIFDIKSVAIRNGTVYLNISPLILIISTAVSYIVLSVIRKFTGRRNAEKGALYTVNVSVNQTECFFSAFLDTGNSLSDPLSGAPVIILEYPLIADLLPETAKSVFKDGILGEIPKGMESRYRLIPYSVVGSTGMLPAFKSDWAAIKDAGKTPDVVIAVSPNPLGGEYRAIISSELLYLCQNSTHKPELPAKNEKENIFTK